MRITLNLSVHLALTLITLYERSVLIDRYFSLQVRLLFRNMNMSETLTMIRDPCITRARLWSRWMSITLTLAKIQWSTNTWRRWINRPCPSAEPINRVIVVFLWTVLKSRNNWLCSILHSSILWSRRMNKPGRILSTNLIIITMDKNNHG